MEEVKPVKEVLVNGVVVANTGLDRTEVASSGMVSVDVASSGMRITMGISTEETMVATEAPRLVGIMATSNGTMDMEGTQCQTWSRSTL